MAMREAADGRHRLAELVVQLVRDESPLLLDSLLDSCASSRRSSSRVSASRALRSACTLSSTAWAMRLNAAPIALRLGSGQRRQPERESPRWMRSQARRR